MDSEPEDPPRRTRGQRVVDLVVGLLLLVSAVWAGVAAGTATWDAAVLAVRGETVPATVVAVDHDRRLGRMDDVVVALSPSGVRAELTTPREDLEPGAVVATVVDPAEPTRASLAEDGWPWRTTLPLLLAPLLALAGLLALGSAAVGRRSATPETDEGHVPQAGRPGDPAERAPGDA